MMVSQLDCVNRQRLGMEDLIVGGLLAEMPRLVGVDYVSNHPPQKLTPEFRRVDSASRGPRPAFASAGPTRGRVECRDSLPFDG